MLVNEHFFKRGESLRNAALALYKDENGPNPWKLPSHQIFVYLRESMADFCEGLLELFSVPFDERAPLSELVKLLLDNCPNPPRAFKELNAWEYDTLTAKTTWEECGKIITISLEMLYYAARVCGEGIHCGKRSMRISRLLEFYPDTEVERALVERSGKLDLDEVFDWDAEEKKQAAEIIYERKWERFRFL
jgi:hypothetical protein